MMQKLRYVICLIICLVSFTSLTESQSISTPYVYPLVDWKQLKTQKEKLSACQIPKDILSNLTTDALVETCLSYPLFDAILLAYDGGQKGFDALIRDFNGIGELLKRKDAGSCVLARYREIDPRDYDTSWTPIQRGEFSLRLHRFEIILSQNSIIANMDESTRQAALSITLDKYKMKQQRSLYTGYDFIASAFLAGRIMLQEGHNNFVDTDSNTINLQELISKERITDEKTVKCIIKETERFINHYGSIQN